MGVQVATQDLEPGELEKLPGYLIVIKRGRFRLTLHQRAGRGYHHLFTCRIAVGAIGFTTPVGAHLILRKESPPTYTAPDSRWARDAGYTPGQEIPAGDPVNPLVGAFLWLNDEGVGIHGTKSLWSLGTRASHGCIRVKEEDAVTLFRLTPLGTPVVVT